MVKFKGQVNGIIFDSPKDLFKILDVKLESDLADYELNDIRVTGNFGEVEIGASYEFEGQLVVHEKFGQQFRCSSYKVVFPQEQAGLTKYLSSDKFPGIGAKAAEKIINELGLNAISVIKENPSKVSTLGLTKKQKDSLISGINQMDGFAETSLGLSQLGLTKKVANRIYQLYKEESLVIIKKDPYAILAKVAGYAFKSADEIGKELGISAADPRRIKGAIYQVLSDALNSLGNTKVLQQTLLKQASELLAIDDFDLIVNVINELQATDKLVVTEEYCSLYQIAKAEEEIAQNLHRIASNQQAEKQYDKAKIEQAISKVEQKNGFDYDDQQKEAIIKALQNPISILTGGPGTGKTTIIKGILASLQLVEEIPQAALYSDDPPFLLAAPTGRAAKRMSEVTGIEAKTIHRLLGMGIGDEFDELNELNGQILIIDEMSMVDMFLFKSLVSSINELSRIVFVGDKDQLPSVGAGNVFADLINSQAFATTILTAVHRQDEQSTIIELAHEVNEGNNPAVMFQKTNNYSFIKAYPNQVADVIAQVVKMAIKKNFSVDDIQILTAMYHGPGGITNLNDLLEPIMNQQVNDDSKLIESHNEQFRIGDRVLQLQNNPEKDIFNGQIGKVVGLNGDDRNNQVVPGTKDKLVIAEFDEREVNFSRMDLNDLTRAYAITIHKSQGSEFPLVILTLTMNNYVMLQKNLLYTAITRAAKNLVMVGDPKAFELAMKTPGNVRSTGLLNVLQREFGLSKAESEIEERADTADDQANYLLTKELIYSGKIDAMIGMDHLKLIHQT